MSSFKNVVFIATRDDTSDGSVSSVHIFVASLQNVFFIDTMVQVSTTAQGCFPGDKNAAVSFQDF